MNSILKSRYASYALAQLGLYYQGEITSLDENPVSDSIEPSQEEEEGKSHLVNLSDK